MPTSTNIKYCTKCWEGDWQEVGKYHPRADVIYGNNMWPETIEKAQKLLGDKFQYVGEGHAYSISELYAVEHTDTRYLLWYASDVIPPKADWTRKAIKLLSKYPIVSPFWTEPYGAYVQLAEKEQIGKFKQTEFGFEDCLFSDQAYIAETKTMQGIDYNLGSPIKHQYPPHGGNSFERRVAQWLETTNQRKATLKDFQYRQYHDSLSVYPTQPPILPSPPDAYCVDSNLPPHRYRSD